MLKGIDVSHWNDSLLNEDTLLEYAMHGFVIIKATEGREWTDPRLHQYAGEYLNMDVLTLGNALSENVGFYHYCHPELNTPEVEMNHFIRTIRPYLCVGSAVLALDIEGKALSVGVDVLNAWTCEAVRIIKNITGKPPVIYCGKSTLPYVKEAAALDCGLWLAKYSHTAPTKQDIYPWKFWAFWQSGIKYGLDQDWFNGDESQFRAYAVTMK